MRLLLPRHVQVASQVWSCAEIHRTDGDPPGPGRRLRVGLVRLSGCIYIKRENIEDTQRKHFELPNLAMSRFPWDFRLGDFRIPPSIFAFLFARSKSSISTNQHGQVYKKVHVRVQLILPPRFENRQSGHANALLIAAAHGLSACRLRRYIRCYSPLISGLKQPRHRPSASICVPAEMRQAPFMRSFI